MRPAKLHELMLPSQYALWRRYIYGTDLQTQIGPERFTKLLNQNQAIELVQKNGAIKCKVLNETLINQILTQLSEEPLRSWLSVAFYKLAKQLRPTK